MSINEAEVREHPPINLEATKRIRKRGKRCYELSYKLILENPDWNLVHAKFSVANCGGFIIEGYEHAYLEKDGVIYDPTLDLFFNRDKLYEQVLPVDVHIYNRKKACGLLLEENHFGPWV